MPEKCGDSYSVSVDVTFTCNREAGHGGIHRDDEYRLYFHPSAPPLEVIELPQAREIDPALSRTLGRLRGGIEP
ncbi:hypothetical protein QDA11_gp07 [Microbacterium phage Jayden]|uniref:Uncharacterized protein n=1 Tax=Microbacterium phage Jayden TaxID=2656550 RepID=A0A649VRT1_9CAUD|nr:hypothetical protein QDA11_gp07 [Microbacterium phage Jayden]QGJ95227.1 hypothetical protein PBI_JAYDEN_7 [Microbacterium phage Jayden]